jgi:hypothetical protein
MEWVLLGTKADPPEALSYMSDGLIPISTISSSTITPRKVEIPEAHKNLSAP